MGGEFGLEGIVIGGIVGGAVGSAVLESQERGLIPSIQTTSMLLKSEATHEIIPVVSRGPRHEANVLASDSHLHFETTVDSAGLRV